MTITATAPGKLILVGEYAVLDGAPALVAAVNRRAHVTIDTDPPPHDNANDAPHGDDITVTAPDLSLRARATVTRDGDEPRIAWHGHDAAADPRLRLVTAVLADAARGADTAGRRTPAMQISLRTTAFFDRPGVKLGIGSSAALTVAFAAALAAALGLPLPSLPELVAMHRSAQDGRGSGADIAAALRGGVIDYRGGDTDEPTATGIALPAGVAWRCLWAGHATSTAGYLAQVAAWRARHTRDYSRHIVSLTDVATDAASAAQAGNARALVDAIDAYTDELDAFGQASGTDIVGTAHRALRELAARHGTVYKPSGAGGGDVGIVFSTDPERLESFTGAAGDIGFRTIALACDQQGRTITDSG